MRGFPRALALAVFILPALSVVTPAAAQTYPSRPVHILVGSDRARPATWFRARSLRPSVSRSVSSLLLKARFAGAGSNVAAQFVARSTADGYTLFNGSNTNVTNSVLQSNLAFDFVKDFAPVALIGSMPNILVVNPALGVSNVAELIALAKTKPEQNLSYGSAGTGSAPHLSAELFNMMAGTKLVHVPIRAARRPRPIYWPVASR